MGIAGNLNDGADIPAACGSYFPNDYGLYNMAGNVSEWVLDVYRPLSSMDVSDFRPYRGNVFETQVRDSLKPENPLAQKDSLGRMKYSPVTNPKQLVNRRNYNKAYNINYLDGDYASNIGVEWKNSPKEDTATGMMYQYGITSLITDHIRVYKGGNWKDPAYYMSPGTRRFLDQDVCTDYIGFRCAMTRVGGSIPGK